MDLSESTRVLISNSHGRFGLNKALDIKARASSIPEISKILAATITAEIGDISRFVSPGKLAAFVGIDPIVFKTGKFTGTKMVMSKRGSPYLR